MNPLWHKASEAADDAHLLYANERYDAACNRAYYAMFNGARALLLQRGIDPATAKKHATVLRLFSLHFVKGGPFEAADGRALSEAGQARNQADYSGTDTEREVAEDVMRSLDRFMRKAARFIEDAGNTSAEGR
jgi:uncharacterized protein (UPF0332 family)